MIACKKRKNKGDSQTTENSRIENLENKRQLSKIYTSYIGVFVYREKLMQTTI